MKQTLLHLILLVAASAAPAEQPRLFCNPLDLDYGWAGTQHRHSADPVVVPFKGKYYLFATDDVPGYRVSGDLLTWKSILFTPEQRRLMSDNDIGTYCAPAAATDGNHIYFIRMSRRKGDATVPVMRSDAPDLGVWEQRGELPVTGDPALFLHNGRVWLYHGLDKPTKVFEIDTKTWIKAPDSEVLRQSHRGILPSTRTRTRARRRRVQLQGGEHDRLTAPDYQVIPKPLGSSARRDDDPASGARSLPVSWFTCGSFEP
jgi:hypothetical protein